LQRQPASINAQGFANVCRVTEVVEFEYQVDSLKARVYLLFDFCKSDARASAGLSKLLSPLRRRRVNCGQLFHELSRPWGWRRLIKLAHTSNSLINGIAAVALFTLTHRGKQSILRSE
jgi:hypothetical protein